MADQFDFKDIATFYTTEPDKNAINKIFDRTSKIIFQADGLEDIIFRIGEQEFTIDFQALVMDYGKAVDE